MKFEVSFRKGLPGLPLGAVSKDRADEEIERDEFFGDRVDDLGDRLALSRGKQRQVVIRLASLVFFVEGVEIAASDIDQPTDRQNSVVGQLT